MLSNFNNNKPTMKKITIDQLFQKDNFPQYQIDHNFYKKIADIPYWTQKRSFLTKISIQYKIVVILLFFLILWIFLYTSYQKNREAENVKLAENTDEIARDIDAQLDKMLWTMDYWSRIDLENSNYYESLVPEY